MKGNVEKMSIAPPDMRNEERKREAEMLKKASSDDLLRMFDQVGSISVQSLTCHDIVPHGSHAAMYSDGFQVRNSGNKDLNMSPDEAQRIGDCMKKVRSPPPPSIIFSRRA